MRTIKIWVLLFVVTSVISAVQPSQRGVSAHKHDIRAKLMSRAKELGINTRLQGSAEECASDSICRDQDDSQISIEHAQMPLFVLLDSNTDTTTEEGQNMQLFRIEELMFTSFMCGRRLVLPWLRFDVRNYTWFEAGGNAASADDLQIVRSQGTLGIFKGELGQFLNIQGVEGYFAPNFMDEIQAHDDWGGSLDHIVQVERGLNPPPHIASCNEPGHPNAAFSPSGVLWTADTMSCQKADSDEARMSFLRNICQLKHSRVGIHLFQVGQVQALFGDLYLQWRQNLRLSLDVPLPTYDGPDSFIQAVFGREPFLCAHWRRGDRAFGVEMGLSGLSQMRMNRPDRFAKFIAAKCQVLGISNVLIVTNSGSPGDFDEAVVSLLMAGLRVHRYISPSLSGTVFAKLTAEIPQQFAALESAEDKLAQARKLASFLRELSGQGCGLDMKRNWEKWPQCVLEEQALASRSTYFVAPAATEARIQDSSQFSARVDILRSLAGKQPNTVDICCGDEPTVVVMGPPPSYSIPAGQTFLDVAILVMFAPANVYDAELRIPSADFKVPFQHTGRQWQPPRSTAVSESRPAGADMMQTRITFPAKPIEKAGKDQFTMEVVLFSKATAESEPIVFDSQSIEVRY